MHRPVKERLLLWLLVLHWPAGAAADADAAAEWFLMVCCLLAWQQAQPFGADVAPLVELVVVCLRRVIMLSLVSQAVVLLQMAVLQMAVLQMLVLQTVVLQMVELQMAVVQMVLLQMAVVQMAVVQMVLLQMVVLQMAVLQMLPCHLQQQLEQLNLIGAFPFPVVLVLTTGCAGAALRFLSAVEDLCSVCTAQGEQLAGY
jgi:hypothetical protein